MLEVIQDGEVFRTRDEREAGHFWADNEIVAFIPKIGAAGFALYMLLCFHAKNHTGRSWPSIDTLAKELDVTRPTLRTHMAKLVDAGVILQTKRTSTSPNGKEIQHSYIFTILNLKHPVGGVGQNLTEGGSKFNLPPGQNLTPNNTKNNKTKEQEEIHLSDRANALPTDVKVEKPKAKLRTRKPKSDNPVSKSVLDKEEKESSAKEKEPPPTILADLTAVFVEMDKVIQDDTSRTAFGGMAKLYAIQHIAHRTINSFGTVAPSLLADIAKLKIDEMHPSEAVVQLARFRERISECLPVSDLADTLTAVQDTHLATLVKTSAPTKPPPKPRTPQPYDGLFDATVCGLANIPIITKEARAAWGWRAGQIIHGDKRSGRCDGLLAYEAMRCHISVSELDYPTLERDMGLFWASFRREHPDLDLADCAKFLEKWDTFRTPQNGKEPEHVINYHDIPKPANLYGK